MFNKKYKKIITIEGMNCNHCVKKLEDTLLKIKNIKKAKVNLNTKKATIISDILIEDNLIKNSIEDLDFKVIMIENI